LCRAVRDIGGGTHRTGKEEVAIEDDRELAPAIFQQQSSLLSRRVDKWLILGEGKKAEAEPRSDVTNRHN
jgi:hypothetical protein